MKYRPPLAIKRGRISAAVHITSLHLPRLSAEFFDDSSWVCLSWGDGNSDPLWYVEVTLTGTRFGQSVARFLDRRERRKRRKAANR